MRILSIIQPSEMGPDFRFEDDVWKVNFPAGSEGGGGVPLSTDANNAIVLGTDQGAFISTDLLGAYALTQDNGSKKINLYRFPAGTEFDPETATLVSSVNLIELSGIFDDVAIDGDVITFTDADTGLTLTIDTANLQKVSDIIGSNSVEVISVDGLTTLSVKINPRPDNLIEVTEEGLFVDATNFGGNGGDLDLHQTLAPVENGLCHAVGNSHLVIPHVELTDLAGTPIGYVIDPTLTSVHSIVATPDHCGDPSTLNCTIGKVGVGFADDFVYDKSIDGTSDNTLTLAWKILLNGVDTHYLLFSGDSTELATNYPALDIGSITSFGYVEDVVTDATDGKVVGRLDDALTVYNTVNEQNILTFVPLMPLTLADMANIWNTPVTPLDIREFSQATIDTMIVDEFANPLVSYDAVLPGWGSYFDPTYVDDGVTTGAVHICLAPNTTTPPWDVKYFDNSTSQWVELQTGPVVSAETIDPTVDFANTESQSYQDWFASLANRTQLYVNNTVNSIETDAFGSWNNLQLVNIDANIIRTQAFVVEGAIDQLVIGPNVRFVESRAFPYIYFGTSVTIAEGVTNLHTEAFEGCNFNNKDLIVPDSVIDYGIALGDVVPSTGLRGINNVGKLVIGGGVPVIYASHWLGTLSSTITHLEFRPGITEIYDQWTAAKANCENLIFPQGLIKIGKEGGVEGSANTFEGFNLVKSLTIPGTTRYIASGSFRECMGLEHLTIENGVGEIGDYAFYGYSDVVNGHPLKEFNFLGGELIGNYAFAWWTLADIDFNLVIPATVYEIKEGAFQGHIKAKSLTFAEGCTANVGLMAFSNWHYATKLHISDGIAAIWGAFNNWYRGRELYIGSNIQSLGINEGGVITPEFQYWGSAYSYELGGAYLRTKEVVIPDNVLYIYEAFTGDSQVETIIVSANLIEAGVIGNPAVSNLYMRGTTPPTQVAGSTGFLLEGLTSQRIYVADLANYAAVSNDAYALFVPPVNAYDVHTPAPLDTSVGAFDVMYLDLKTGQFNRINGIVPGIIDADFALNRLKGYIDDVVINSSVSHIGANAFAGNPSIKRIYFVGGDLNSIGQGAFAGSTERVRELALPSALQRIGAGAIDSWASAETFYYGTNLISVDPTSVVTSPKFATPAKMVPPAPVFGTYVGNVVTGTAMAGDKVVAKVKRGEVVTTLAEVNVSVEFIDGAFSIDLATIAEPTTLVSGDRLQLSVVDIVGNASNVAETVFM